jgi:hypothetical protein
MFNNVAFDVFIGLVFIYLLYSLLATIIMELFATMIGLRARNLREAIDRMLNDEDDAHKGWWARFRDSVNILKKPKSLMVKNFYNHPEIKYLGSTGIFKNPSSFKAVSFSKTIIYLLSGEGSTDKAKISNKLNLLVNDPGTVKKEEIILDKETAKYVLSLWDDSYGDLIKFKLLLETWFDRTMEQCLEWYKRKTQVILLVLGFLIAWIAGADTFIITKKLSTDKDAREKMVQMASAYIQNNPRPEDIRIKLERDSTDDEKKLDSIQLNKLDSLLEIKKQLEKDIADANTVLGINGWLPDKVRYVTDNKGNRIYTTQVDEEALEGLGIDLNNGEISFKGCDKWTYFFLLFWRHFFGFLITALAISLGAPFWYDLLNKLMKLRTAVKQPIRSPHNSADLNGGDYVSPLNREG